MDQFRPSRFQILPLVVKNLLIINGLMFLATVVCSRYNLDLTDILGLHYFASAKFQPYQLISHMFMHGSFLHIFSNMFALWMFGSVLENVWGAKRFFIFYFACGLGGAFMHLGVSTWQYYHLQEAINQYQSHPGIPEFSTLAARYDYLLNMGQVQNFLDAWKLDPNNPGYVSQSMAYAHSFLDIFADIPIVGASGAVFGVLVAFGLLFPDTYLYIYFFLPVKAKYFVIFYALFELYAGFTGAEDGVAHFAHIGGALIGFVIVKFWNRNRRKDFY